MDGALRWLYACRGESIGVGQTTSRSKIGFHLLTNLGDSMKKLTLVAGAVLGLVSATSAMAQSSVTLYGIVDAAVTYTTKQNAAGDSRTGIDAGQLASSRWGMRGTEDLGGGLKANFVLESGIANDNGAGGGSFGGNTPPGPTTPSLFDRQATVGISGDFGAITLGRQNTVVVDAISLAEPSSYAQAGNNPNVAYGLLNSGALYGTFGTNDGGSAFRQNNSIRYATPVMSGFGGALMYGFGEQPSNSSANSYAGISGFFTNGASGVSLGYAQLNNSADNSKLTMFAGGAKYAVTSELTLRATYAQNKVDTTNRKIAVAGVGVDFMVMPALTLTGAYYNVKRSGDVDGKVNQFVGLAKYALSKRTSMYTILTHVKAGSTAAADVGLSSSLISAGNDRANRFAVGVIHTF